MNHQGFDSVIIGLVDKENNILAASIILIQKIRGIKYAYAPRGFLIDYNDDKLLETFTLLLKKYLSKLGIVAIKISPIIVKNIYDKKYDILTKNEYFDKIYQNLLSLGYKPISYKNDFDGLKPKYEAIIDLDKPYYLLFKDLNKEYRTKIRSASKNGIQIFKSDNLEYLYLQTKKKYPRDLEYFNDCYKYFSKNNDIDFYYTKLNTDEYLKNRNKELQEQEKRVNYYNEQILENKKNIIKKKENNKEEKILKERIEFENAFNEVLIETKLQTQKEKSSLKL